MVCGLMAIIPHNDSNAKARFSKPTTNGRAQSMHQSSYELQTAVKITAVFLTLIGGLHSRPGDMGAFVRELTAKGLVAIIHQDEVTL